ncbi:MAG: thiamine diphosphokinase [Bacteroidales bacterium]
MNKEMINNSASTVILANGEFPSHEVPLTILKDARNIICCDGAAAKLIKAGMKPTAIVGDMDSLSPKIQQEYREIIFKSECQESNDLTKAFNYALALKSNKITILGATGMRDDHSIANVSLLANYAIQTDTPVEMFTNYGLFKVIFKGGKFHSNPGQQISFFSLDSNIKIESKGLKYPLDDVKFDSWWKATLNECEDSCYHLKLSLPGPVIVFLVY